MRTDVTSSTVAETAFAARATPVPYRARRQATTIGRPVGVRTGREGAAGPELIRRIAGA